MRQILTKSEYDHLWAWVQKFIMDLCIARGVMPAKNGGYYSWMLYLRRGLYNHQFLSAVSQMFLCKMQERLDMNNIQLSGPETAAAPILAGVPLIARIYDYDLPAFIVRKEQKYYGLRNWFEGLPDAERPAVLFDDMCNSSEALAHAYNRIREASIPVAPYAFTIVNKVYKDPSRDNVPERNTEHRRRSDLYLPPDIEVVSLFTLDDLGLTGNSH